MKTIEAITASPNPGVKTLTGEGWAVALTITEHKAAQVERANASSATSSFTGSGCCPERRDSVIRK